MRVLLMKSMTRQTLHSIIGLLFVISGGLGLTYQIVWFKYLSLFLGNTTYAQTIVLATFMGGLALGAARWGKRADRAKNPIRLYAFLELGIGVYCLLFPGLLDILKSVFLWFVISSNLRSDGTPVMLLKLFLSLCMLLIPTILMGGTLPVLVRFISRRMEETGRNVAVLYFLNSFGAVIGSFLAGFFFIRILGLQRTIVITAIANLVVGGVAVLLSMLPSRAKGTAAEPVRKNARIFSRREISLAIAVAGISGLASMIYEVSWVRLLIPIVGSSIYSFSLMLIAFISGITIGSLIVSSLVRKVRNLPSLLAWCQAGIVLSLLGTFPLYARIPYIFWKVAATLPRSDSTYPIFLSLQFGLCIIMMIVPTIFLGMSLPVATRIAARGIRILGKSVGTVFAVNTLGTVVGSLLAGLVLIPLVGIKHAIEIGIGCNAFAALFLFVLAAGIPRRQLVFAGSAGMLMLIGYLWLGQSWNRSIMLSGIFRRISLNAAPPERFSEYQSAVNSKTVYYYKEGTTATVGVVENGPPGNSQKTLVINGKEDASSKGDLPTQVLLGQLPCLLHPNPQNALVVGLGSGVTLGSVLTHPLKTVDCVEISPEVVDASLQFNDVNHRPFDDPRLKLYIEDALAFLQLTPQKYDIIVSEPSNPWIAGIGNLYTTEFFETCKKRMNEGGMMIQWFHIYEMNNDIFQMVARTFQASFRHVSIWQPLSADVILLGSDRPLSIDFGLLESRIETHRVREDLARILIPDAGTLLSLEMLSSRSTRFFAGAGPLNTEDHPLLEYEAPSASFINRGVDRLTHFDERMSSNRTALEINERAKITPLSDRELRNIGLFHTTPFRNSTLFGYSILREYLARHPRDIPILERASEVAEQSGLTKSAVELCKAIAELEPENPGAQERYAWAKYVREHMTATTLTPLDTREFERRLNRSIGLAADTVARYRVRLGDIYFGTQQYAKAIAQFERAIQIRYLYGGDPGIRDDALLLQLARCYHFLGDNNRAFGCGWDAIRINPHNEGAKDLLYEIQMGESSKAP
jgi:spermidine synthase